MSGPPTRRSVGRPRGPAVDPASRRADLLDAASRVIRRQGATASMEDLAAEAGVTKPILYAHFGDRAGLASALAERFVDQVAERLTDAFVAAAGAPEQSLRYGLDAFVGFVEEDANVYQFIVRESVNAASSGKAPSIARLRVFDSLGTLITDGLRFQLREAGRDPAAAEPIAFATMGMVFGAAEWWLDRRTLTRAQLVDLLGDLLWAGLRGRREA
jgi:AcrR family transcriptional regulator